MEAEKEAARIGSPFYKREAHFRSLPTNERTAYLARVLMRSNVDHPHTKPLLDEFFRLHKRGERAFGVLMDISQPMLHRVPDEKLMERQDAYLVKSIRIIGKRLNSGGVASVLGESHMPTHLIAYYLREAGYRPKEIAQGINFASQPSLKGIVRAMLFAGHDHVEAEEEIRRIPLRKFEPHQEIRAFLSDGENLAQYVQSMRERGLPLWEISRSLGADLKIGWGAIAPAMHAAGIERGQIEDAMKTNGVEPVMRTFFLSTLRPLKPEDPRKAKKALDQGRRNLNAMWGEDKLEWWKKEFPSVKLRKSPRKRGSRGPWTFE